MIVGFLRKLFGGSSARGSDKDGMYFYVRGQRSGEVIQLRLHRYNDLSQSDDQKTFHVRKVAVGQRNFERIEVEFIFDKNRNFLTAEVTGGELVEREDYEAFLAAQASPPGTES